MPSRVLLPAAVLALALFAAPGAAAASSARAVLVACEHGVADAERAGVFEGRMSGVAGAARMQMRFVLQVRPPRQVRWSAVAAPGFGAWVSSDPGVQRYVYTKRVQGLMAPASYRVAVRFRWLDAAGLIIAKTRALSRTCSQPDPRPNLVVRSITVRETADPARRSYLVLVRNTGRAAAAPSAVRLSVGGIAMVPGDAPELAAGATALVALEGPACEPEAVLEAVADAADEVEERSEGDNALSRPCA